MINDPEIASLFYRQLVEQASERVVAPPAHLADRLFETVFPPSKAESFLTKLPERNARAVVVSDAAGTIEWVSPAFSRMCGFSLAELRGHKAGRLLQGAGTDPISAAKLSSGIRNGVEVRAELVNYHKSGTAYAVEIHLFPLRSETGDLVGFIAVEDQVSQASA